MEEESSIQDVRKKKQKPPKVPWTILFSWHMGKLRGRLEFPPRRKVSRKFNPWWYCINLGFKILVILWGTSLPFYKIYVDYLHFGKSISLDATLAGVLTLSIAFIVLIRIYWDWSDIPVLSYLGFSSWVLSHPSPIIHVGKILFNVPLLLGGVFIIFAIIGLEHQQNE